MGGVTMTGLDDYIKARDEAQQVANEVFYQVMRTKSGFKGAYDYITAEMDISDEAMTEAARRLFPAVDFDELE